MPFVSSILGMCLGKRGNGGRSSAEASKNGTSAQLLMAAFKMLRLMRERERERERDKEWSVVCQHFACDLTSQLVVQNWSPASQDKW